MRMIKRTLDGNCQRLNDQQRIMLTHNHEIEKINNSILKMLKNTNVENRVLDREIERMHKIDRIKVANAKTSLFVPELGNVFPSLELFNANNPNHSVSI